MTGQRGQSTRKPTGGQQGAVVINKTCRQATKIELAIIYLVSGLTLLVEHHKKLYLPTFLCSRHI